VVSRDRMEFSGAAPQSMKKERKRRKKRPDAYIGLA